MLVELNSPFVSKLVFSSVFQILVFQASSVCKYSLVTQSGRKKKKKNVIEILNKCFVVIYLTVDYCLFSKHAKVFMNLNKIKKRFNSFCQNDIVLKH